LTVANPKPIRDWKTTKSGDGIDNRAYPNSKKTVNGINNISGNAA
jgi:hypothetical protein